MTVRERTPLELDERERAAVLAGLRMLQHSRVWPMAVTEVATNMGTLSPLVGEDIDALCERINS